MVNGNTKWMYKLTDKFGNVYRGTASQLSRELFVSEKAIRTAYLRGGMCCGCWVDRYRYVPGKLFEE